MGKSARRRVKQRRRVEAPPPKPVGRAGMLAVAAASLAAVVGGTVLFALAARGDEPPRLTATGAPSQSDALGIQRGPAPWVAEQTRLPTRLDRIGIPFSNMEGTAVHIHPTLEVYVNGDEVEVPRDIGISDAERAMAALHTHDANGTIHVESPVVRDYSLGQFFDTWGVRLTRNCIGSHCADGTRRLRAFVDGRPVADPRALKLVDEQNVVVAYGTAAEIQAALG